MYRIVPTAQFEKDLKKVGQSNAVAIIKWIVTNLEGNDNPRQQGRRLRHGLKQYWRYRIGDFRLFVDIQDDCLVLELITVGHRREIYKNQ